MNIGRDFTFEIPECVLVQVQQRAIMSGRLRSAQMRHLISMGLEFAGDDDTNVTFPADERLVRTTLRIPYDILETIKDRGAQFNRSTGREVVSLIIYAIEEAAKRDLEAIRELMSREAQRHSRTA